MGGTGVNNIFIFGEEIFESGMGAISVQTQMETEEATATATR